MGTVPSTFYDLSLMVWWYGFGLEKNDKILRPIWLGVAAVPSCCRTHAHLFVCLYWWLKTAPILGILLLVFLMQRRVGKLEDFPRCNSRVHHEPCKFLRRSSSPGHTLNFYIVYDSPIAGRCWLLPAEVGMERSLVRYMPPVCKQPYSFATVLGCQIGSNHLRYTLWHLPDFL